MLQADQMPAHSRPARRTRPDRLAARQALGASLARARGFWGLTQEQVGAVVGVSKVTVGKWEGAATGEEAAAEAGEPGSIDLLLLARFFGVPMEALCTGVGLAFDPAAPAGRKETT